MEFVDIAGIVKGASQGAGLGNKFLANIRQTDAIVQVVRCFVDDDIIHVDGSVDPLRDIEIIELELVLADIAQIEKKIEKARKDKKTDPLELSALEKANTALQAGKPARSAGLSIKEREAIKTLMLLTLKPVIYAANVGDSDLAEGNELSKKVFAYAEEHGSKAVLVSAQVPPAFLFIYLSVYCIYILYLSVYLLLCVLFIYCSTLLLHYHYYSILLLS